VTDTAAPPAEGGQMSLMEHLVELRSRLIKCAVAVAIGACVGWILYPHVLNILQHPLDELAKGHGHHVSKRFLSTKPLEIFLLKIKMSAYIGIILAMPFLLWQLWQFVSPGLYKNERRYAASFVVSASVLFATGAVIAYFTLTPALLFLTSMGGGAVDFKYSAEDYVMLIVYMMLAFGAGFQFPILLVFLQLVGVLTPQQLSQFRRFGIVIIFVIAAVITPSADPISLFALAVPMCLFYEISILIGRLVKRRRAKAEAS
jgi:sec-independent protein translocase protein TatC